MKQQLIIIAAATAAGILAVTSVPQSYAQYGAGSIGTATQEQLLRCEELEIDRNQCNDVTILAKERLLYAQKTTYGNNPDGSGTPYFKGIETFTVIGVLGAIFGGVAGAFYMMGRKGKQVPV
ncbi:MAG: hypothetical protein QXX64_00715 [Nitrososphaera sp.]